MLQGDPWSLFFVGIVRKGGVCGLKGRREQVALPPAP